MFEGDAPQFEYNCFGNITATAYYARTATGWNTNTMQQYGGTITWKLYCKDDVHAFDQPVAEAKYLVSEATCTAKAVYFKSCVCGEPGTETFEYGEKLLMEGWVKEGTKWTYYEDGVKVTNKWVKDGSKWCYIGADGYMATNAWAKDGSKWCYVDQNGYQVFNKWVKDGGKWYYIGEDGYMATGWIKDGNNWLYADPAEYCLYWGVCTIDGKEYTDKDFVLHHMHNTMARMSRSTAGNTIEEQLGTMFKLTE